MRVWFGSGITPSGNLNLRVNGVVGDAVDFSNSREARQIQLNPQATFRVGRNVEIRLTESFQRLETLAGEEIFTATLSQARAVYNFSPRSFVRAIVQYRNTDRNPLTNESTVQRSRETVFSQLLFSYKVNPQTVFFLGYADNRVGSVLEDRTEIPLTQTNRSFFLKVGYAWRP